jgi:hypothetical protein
VVALPVGIPAIVGLIGFTEGGIAAGSMAASIMSLYGGAVPAGSACAILQSVGAAGLASSTTTVLSAIGGVFGAAASSK